MLLNAPTEEELCLTCHGAAGTGATTDVMTGVQYAVGTGGAVRGTTQLGALRNGGFDQARIDAGNPARLSYSRTATAISQRPKVGVGAAENVTSAHLALPENGLTATGIAWGNGANGSGAGPTVPLSCASCHNPHGNGQYRILNPIPTLTATTGTFTAVTTAANVTDSPLGTADPVTGAYPTKNYTVIQVKGTAGSDASYLLYASQVQGVYGDTAGDYFHRNVPWMTPTDTTVVGGGPVANDAPNGQAATFNGQITAWCSSCHTRYYADQSPNPAGGTGPAWQYPRPGDDLYKFQHRTISNRACTTCHVSHGSNAVMPGVYSSTVPLPNGVATTAASSRLLKIDNRGTCQACHDPTLTTVNGTYYGPLPMPAVP